MIYIIIAVIICGLMALFCYRYVKRAFNSIDAVLDRVLNKDTSLLTEMADEKRISKLTHKAGRIVDMCMLEVAQTKEEKETIQGFISDMSHQMKTPLSGISMYADLLLDCRIEILSPAHIRAAGCHTYDISSHEFLSRIKSNTEKLQWIMDSLIKMSRLEIGAVLLAPIKANIKQTISDAIETVIAQAAKKNINISVADFNDMPVYHDKKWTREAIVNILENAVKYSTPDGEINISVEPLTLYTKIIITDQGIGIDKNDWHLIFKRFYRGQNAKEKEGAGLGLYLAALIMQKQGGYIMVDSVLGKYTAFSLFLQNCKI